MSNNVISAADLFDDKDSVFRIKAGEKLFNQGDKPDNVYVIKSGTADVVIDGRVVESASRGTILGEMALIDPAPRSASIVATSDCTFNVIAPDLFEELIRKHPHFATLVMRSLVKRLRNADQGAIKISP